MPGDPNDLLQETELFDNTTSPCLTACSNPYIAILRVFHPIDHQTLAHRVKIVRCLTLSNCTRYLAVKGSGTNTRLPPRYPMPSVFTLVSFLQLWVCLLLHTYSESTSRQAQSQAMSTPQQCVPGYCVWWLLSSKGALICSHLSWRHYWLLLHLLWHDFCLGNSCFCSSRKILGGCWWRSPNLSLWFWQKLSGGKSLCWSTRSIVEFVSNAGRQSSNGLVEHTWRTMVQRWLVRTSQKKTGWPILMGFCHPSHGNHDQPGSQTARTQANNTIRIGPRSQARLINMVWIVLCVLLESVGSIWHPAFEGWRSFSRWHRG